MNDHVSQACLNLKKVTAAPMTRGEYTILRGWTLSDNENGNDPGYLLEHLDGSQPNHPKYSGFITWITQKGFATSYQLVSLGSPSIYTRALPNDGQSVTPEDVDNAISSYLFITPHQSGVINPGIPKQDAEQLKRVTLCFIVLKNGFIITGESVCADIHNFNAETGRQMALTNAKEKSFLCWRTICVLSLKLNLLDSHV